MICQSRLASAEREGEIRTCWYVIRFCMVRIDAAGAFSALELSTRVVEGDEIGCQREMTGVMSNDRLRSMYDGGAQYNKRHTN